MKGSVKTEIDLSCEGTSMFAIIGLIVVFGGIIGGYVMHGGPMMVLFQPNEYLIIGGAAIGSLLIATPLKTIK